jgi:hypothetical protein
MSARWKITPVQPTWDMCGDGAAVPERPVAGYINRVYDAMLASAPPASEDAELVESLAREILRIRHGYVMVPGESTLNEARAVLAYLAGAQ